MATSTSWDNARGDRGDEGSGNVSSMSGVDSYGFSESTRGLLDGNVRVN